MEKEQKKTTSQVDNNMRYYEECRVVPETAKKTIQDGRLRGKTDINPMWRIKKLTELFGPCGFGWKYIIRQKWIEPGNDNNAAAFVDIDLYVKDPKTGEWSEAIPGTGGNIFKRLEGSGKLYVDDECYKKATTDALSVACKALGIGADVYWESDSTKYDKKEDQTSEKEKTKRTLTPQSSNWAANVAKVASLSETTEKIKERISKVYNITDEDFKALLKAAGKDAA